MTEQGVLQDQGMNEEQRIQAEAALQDRRLDLVQQVSDLEKARDLLVNRLRRLINRNISVVNFSIIEENYRNLQNINSGLNLRILDWEDLLQTDEEGNPIYPDRGQPEFCYSPGAEDFTNKTKAMELVSAQSIEALKAFYLALSAADKATVSQTAQTVFLRNPAEWIPPNLDQADEQDKQQTSDTEDDTAGNNTEQEDDTAGNNTNVQCSPRNSIESSKSVVLRGRNYQARKERISALIQSIESDPEGIHSENLEKQTTILNSMLRDLNIPGIIELANTEPDFLKIFGETEDQVNDWSEDARFRIQDLTLRAAKEVCDRKLLLKLV